jgi:hypothetical protein
MAKVDRKPLVLYQSHSDGLHPTPSLSRADEASKAVAAIREELAVFDEHMDSVLPAVDRFLRDSGRAGLPAPIRYL